MNWQKGEFSINTDPLLLDIPFIHQFLSNSYWAKNIPLDLVARSIEGSLSFGVYKNKKQIGFARVITDKATFAYLGDVFIDETYRGQGLSKWLMEVILSHPDLQQLRRFMLLTRDAHELYRKFGFQEATSPENIMVIHRPDVYQE